MALSEKLRVNFTPEERVALEAIAKAEERSVAAIIRRAVRQMLRELERAAA